MRRPYVRARDANWRSPVSSTQSWPNCAIGRATVAIPRSRGCRGEHVPPARAGRARAARPPRNAERLIALRPAGEPSVVQLHKPRSPWPRCLKHRREQRAHLRPARDGRLRTDAAREQRQRARQPLEVVVLAQLKARLDDELADLHGAAHVVLDWRPHAIAPASLLHARHTMPRSGVTWRWSFRSCPRGHSARWMRYVQLLRFSFSMRVTCSRW